MLLVALNEAQCLFFCCSLAYPRVRLPRRRFSDRQRSRRYASGGKRGQGEGWPELELARANEQEQLRIESEPNICGAETTAGFAYRIAAKRLSAELVKLDAAAAQFERGQRERPDPELLLHARAAEGRPRVVSATCWSTATSLPAAYASQARRTQA